MRYTIAIILTMFLASAALGANETALLLEAPRVDQALFVEANGKGLKYKIDKGSLTELKDDTTFKAASTIDVALENYNPLKLSFATSEAFRDDETAKDIAKFLQTVIDTAGTVGIAPEPGEADTGAIVDPSAASRRRMTQNTRFLNVLEEDVKRQQMTKEGCENYALMHGWLVELRKLMREKIIDKKVVENWVSKSEGLQGVKDVRKDMKDTLEALDANAKAISGVVDAIAKHFARSFEKSDVAIVIDNRSELRAILDDEDRREKFAKMLKNDDLQATVRNFQLNDEKDPFPQILSKALAGEPSCDEVHASTFAALLDVTRDAANIEAQKASAAKDLAALHKSLGKYEKGWRENGKDYIILQPKPNPQKIDKVTVTLTERIKPAEDITVLFTEAKEASTGSFDLRKYQAIIGEVAAALVYTDMKYKTFVTGKDDSGNTVVREVEDNDFPIEGAMTLNLIPAFLGSNSFVHPMFQLGVSSAKDAPGFLAGVGLRFTQMRQLSIAIGRMVTWQRALKTLTVDGPVKDQATIDADLDWERAPAAWYGGIQYSF